jgi:hypothetical protein
MNKMVSGVVIQRGEGQRQLALFSTLINLQRTKARWWRATCQCGDTVLRKKQLDAYFIVALFHECIIP